MNRTKLGLLASLMIGMTAVGVGPAQASDPAPAGSVEVARHRDDDDKKHNDGKNDEKDSHKKKWDKDRDDRRHRDDDDRRCVGLIVICG